MASSAPGLQWRMIAYAAHTYGQVVHTYLWNRRRIPREHRRPLGFCLKFLIGYPLFASFTLASLLFDDVFYRRYRRQPVSPPVFIIGNPRSGTTLLHRLLALDTQRFYCFHLWEVILPAIVQTRLVQTVGWIDRILGGPVRWLVKRQEARALNDTNHIHPMSLSLPEEDHLLLIHLLALSERSLVFPAVGFPDLLMFDEAIPHSEQALLMTFYETCVQRRAYLSRSGERLLSKSPPHTGRISALHERFPEARFIYIVRNPLDVTGSVLNAARTSMRMFFHEEPAEDLDQKAFAMIRRYYHDALAKLDALPPDRVAVVRYDDLIARPRETVERLYNHFQFPLAAEFATVLDEHISQMSSYQSRHKYTLDGGMISAQRIVDELSDIFQRFEFDTRGLSTPALPAVELHS